MDLFCFLLLTSCLFVWLSLERAEATKRFESRIVESEKVAKSCKKLQNETQPQTRDNTSNFHEKELISLETVHALLIAQLQLIPTRSLPLQLPLLYC